MGGRPQTVIGSSRLTLMPSSSRSGFFTGCRASMSRKVVSSSKIAKVMYGFFGNLEVVSKDGFDTFASNLESCKKTVDWKGTDPDWKFGPYGEDLFMQKCMEKVGVQKQSDFYMDADGACPAKRPKALRKSPKTWHPSCEGNQAIVIH